LKGLQITNLIFLLLLGHEDLLVNYKRRRCNFDSAVAKEVAPKVEEIEHIVTAETFADNPELAAKEL
jgi:hypothetical protein